MIPIITVFVGQDRTNSLIVHYKIYMDYRITGYLPSFLFHVPPVPCTFLYILRNITVSIREHPGMSSEIAMSNNPSRVYKSV